MSQATAVLERRGLVVRSHLPACDRRRVLLALTPAGRTAILDTIDAFRKHGHLVIAPFVEALWVEPAPAAADAQAQSRPQGVVAG